MLASINASRLIIFTFMIVDALSIDNTLDFPRLFQPPTLTLDIS